MKKIIYYIMLFALAVNVFLDEAFISCAAENTSAQCNFTNLIVFAKFDGEDEFIDTVYEGTSVRKIIDNSYNTADYNVADYYRAVSTGKLQMNSVYLFVNGGSITLTHPRGYYAEYSEENTIGYQENERGTRMYELKLDWANAINEAVAAGNKISNYDGTQQYDYKDLDKNGDGIIDAITIIYKNTTQNNISVSWASPLWDYQDEANYVTINTDGGTLTSAKYVQLTNSYEKAPGDSNGYLYKDAQGNVIVSLGKVIHETGHILGLKDLYNSSSVSPVYYMSVMAKPLSPVPQFISLKEQEALGWVNNQNVPTLTSNGEYSLTALGSGDDLSVVGYKMDIPEKNKTLYLEYRNFAGEGNRYDSQNKVLYKANGALSDATKLQSGLICYLVDSNTKFPNNMGLSAPRWNYEVLGGQYSTKIDAAVKEGEDILITSEIAIEVTEIIGNKLTFRINGISGEHVHTGGEATCIAQAICSVCHQPYGEIDAENHKNTEMRNIKKPTSTETGYSGDLYCKDCDKKLQTGTLIPKEAPSIIEGKDITINVTENETVTFRSNALFADFIRVELDGKELVRDADYTVKEGSTIVQLLPQILKSLVAGKHSLGIVSASGTALTEFTVIDTIVPAPTTTPVATPTATPLPTRDPIETEPVATKEPAVTKAPTATEAPAATKEPTVTKAPTVTEEPVTTVTPDATEAPAEPNVPVVEKDTIAMAAPMTTKKPIETKTSVSATSIETVTTLPDTSDITMENGQMESTVNGDSPTEAIEKEDVDDIALSSKQDNIGLEIQTEEDTDKKFGWLIGIVVVCGGIIVGVTGWMIWKRYRK